MLLGYCYSSSLFNRKFLVLPLTAVHQNDRTNTDSLCRVVWCLHYSDFVHVFKLGPFQSQECLGSWILLCLLQSGWASRSWTAERLSDSDRANAALVPSSKVRRAREDSVLHPGSTITGETNGT